jgi:rhomboid protease GluP
VLLELIRQQMMLPAISLLFLAFAWVAEAIRLTHAQLRKPILTWCGCGLLLATLISQLAFPQLLALFQRDATRIFAGEWWRVLSALFFQDGGLIGGLTNILTLFWIGSAVEQVRSRWNWLAVGLAGALIAECAALRWQPVGAGNSVFTCSLAGSLITSGRFSRLPNPSKILRVAAILVAFFLVAAHDLHGVAAMAGIVLGWLIHNGTLQGQNH